MHIIVGNIYVSFQFAQNELTNWQTCTLPCNQTKEVNRVLIISDSLLPFTYEFAFM